MPFKDAQLFCRWRAKSRPACGHGQSTAPLAGHFWILLACPTGPPEDNHFRSLKVHLEQIQKRGFCDLIFSIAKRSVVKKSSGLSHTPLSETLCSTHTHTHTQNEKVFVSAARFSCVSVSSCPGAQIRNMLGRGWPAQRPLL